MTGDARDESAGGAPAPIVDGGEESFRLLVEGVRDYAIFMLDPEGRVLTWNEAARRMKGYESDEIVGEHFSRFYTQDSIDAGHPQRELALATADGRYEEEGWRVRKDGSHFMASVVITALYDESGRLRGFGKVTRDITERLENQARLADAIAESERHLLGRKHAL